MSMNTLYLNTVCSKILAVLTGNGGGGLQMTSGRPAPLPKQRASMLKINKVHPLPLPDPAIWMH